MSFKTDRRKRVIRNRLILLGVLSALALPVVLYFAFRKSPAELESLRIQKIGELRQLLAEKLGPQILHNQLPEKIDLEFEGSKKEVQINYTLDPQLQSEATKLLKAYKPDYGAIVIMNANTGAVLAMASFQKGQPDAPNLALRGTYPAASIFKIVTATAAVDRYNMSPDSIVLFNGGNYTLYRKNVLSGAVNRWTRGMSIRDAFARSINTAFGRLTLERMQPQDLEHYAIRFGFNKHIQSDLPFDPGFAQIPNEKGYHLAEIASGFNRVTTMSPVQGAMIASSVAADGVMPVPYIVDSISDKNGTTLFKAEPVTAAVTMSPEGADKLKEMMGATVSSGTSRSAFRNFLKDKKFRELELGGKTGSLTGDNPKGKVDWFVGYGIGENESLAVAAITVNVKYWTVKSSYLAQSLLKKHFKEQYTRNAASVY